MKRIISGLVLSLFFVAPALAQEANAPAGTAPAPGAVRQVQPNAARPLPVQREVKDASRNAREAAQAARENLREELNAKREEARQTIEARRQEFKAEMEAKREELKRAAEARKEELRKKLQAVKDERKKQIVERLDTRIQELNGKRLEHFSNALGRIEAVLQKIVSRADKAEANGREVSAVRSAIENVKTAVAAARDAIAAQAGKSYSISVTTEANLKTDVGRVRQQLVADLKAVQDKVQAARQALAAAAQALARIPQVDDEVNPAPPSGATQ